MLNQQNLPETSLGDIACNIAGATKLFRKHKLDFCCGGKNSLRSEAQRRGIDLHEITDQLLQLTANDNAEISWKDATTPDLVAHILGRFHAKHREQLPELVRLAQRVEKVHAEHEKCPHGLAEHLMAMAVELEEHMQKEEQILFPMLLSERKSMTSGPISVMENEHTSHGEALEEMLRLGHNLEVHTEACNTWRALYLGLDQLRNDLMEHIHLENNILFKRTESDGPCSHTCSCA
jgi:regulator of cell morphogenesis and NO signaling